jgi:hypothetical protein
MSVIRVRKPLAYELGTQDLNYMPSYIYIKETRLVVTALNSQLKQMLDCQCWTPERGTERIITGFCSIHHAFTLELRSKGKTIPVTGREGP